MRRMPKLQQPFTDWLPDYVNGNLAWPKRWLIRLWLRQSAPGRARLNSLVALRSTIRQQKMLQPDADRLAKIQEQIRRRPAVASARKEAKPRLLTRRAFVLVELLLILLAIGLIWQAVPPGNLLQWTNTAPAETFRVYRAPASGRAGEFVLIREVTADEQRPSYAFLDVQLAPGQDYVYRVETLQPSGFLAVSEPIVAPANAPLAGQLLTFLTLILAALLIFASLNRGSINHRPNHLNGI